MEWPMTVDTCFNPILLGALYGPLSFYMPPASMHCQKKKKKKKKAKVKFSLSTPWRHILYVEAEVLPHSFLTSAMDEGD
jgi:hypothetical protein